jgi:hypothetical protein
MISTYTVVQQVSRTLSQCNSETALIEQSFQFLPSPNAWQPLLCIYEFDSSKPLISVESYSICLSGWLIIVSIMSLGSSTLQHRSDCTSFEGWILFHCGYVPHIVYPSIPQRTLGLLAALGYYGLCCSEHGRVLPLCVSWNGIFFYSKSFWLILWQHQLIVG